VPIEKRSAAPPMAPRRGGGHLLARSALGADRVNERIGIARPDTGFRGIPRAITEYLAEAMGTRPAELDRIEKTLGF
jgi:hypothetical protein